MALLDIVWESYHSDGRPRNTPLPSTIHGWLTKMRGTILDNETIRYRGIKEMKQAAAVRVHRRKAAVEDKRRAVSRAKAGKPPLQPLAKQPLLCLSFLGNRPKPIAGASYRPTPTTRKSSSSSHSHKKKSTHPPSKSRHSNSSGKRGSKRSRTSRKSSTSKRSLRK